MPVNAPNRCIPCDTCGTSTPHALINGDSYACGICGETVLYHINHARPMYGMDLRESPDARERFDNWTQDAA